MHIPYLRKSFTLIEMVAVMGIIMILLAMILPNISEMWNQTHIRNTHQKIANLLKVAKSRSLSPRHMAYGLMFYVDPANNYEVAVFIDALTYPVTSDEKWPDVIDRFRVDTENRYLFPMRDFVRIAPFNAFEWEDEDLLNNDYRAGKQRNFFAIIFQRGRRAHPWSYILYDVDEDDDGLGDILKLPVGDTVGDYGGVLRDIVLDEDDEPCIIPTDWGFLIYDENTFKEFRPDYLDSVPCLPYSLTKHGKVIALEREK